MRKHFINKAKKISAVLLGAAMTMNMGAMPAFAASAAPVAGVSGEQADVSGLVGTVTINGIREADKDSVTVKAYQVVDGVYTQDKLVRYVLMDPVNGAIASIGNEDLGTDAANNDIISEDEIVAIADNIRNGNFTADGEGTTLQVQGNGSYQASLEPGMYVILVSGATDTVYNPAVVAVNLTDANADAGTDIAAGSVNLSNFFQTYADGETTNVYLKSSLSSMDKNITGSMKDVAVAEGDTTGTNLEPENAKGDTVAFGDTVYFELTDMTIPSFSKDYVDPVYQITDQLDADAFGGIRNIVVKVNDEVIDLNTDYTLTAADGGTFTEGTSKNFRIRLTQALLDEHRTDSASIEVTYESTLLSTAGLNYAENVNNAKLEYSIDPSDSSEYKTIYKNTYHYTFGIDALLDGQDGTNKQTHEFNKVTEASTNGGADYVDADDVNAKKSSHALADAVFTIYSDEACENPVMRDGVPYTATSNANGHFSFVGLDEGTYYVRETTAPDNYTLSPNLYKFVISATLDEATGILQEYSITTQYKDVTTGSDWADAGNAVYTNNLVSADVTEETGRVTNSVSEVITPMEVVDTRLQSLPSTGASGTIVITLVAAAGMAAFLGIYLNGKKKENLQ